MKKKLGIVIIILLMLLFLGYKFVYQSHRNISAEESTFSLTTQQLIEAYAVNEDLANAKFLDKTITVTGKITAFNDADNSISVDEKLFGILNEKNANIKKNDSVTFKGRFIGYDDLLEEVKMDQITIIN
jgi:hypothetical protein